MSSPNQIAGTVCLTCQSALPGASISSASTADETISLKTTILPKGKLYRKRRVPAKMQLCVQVQAPASSAKINPPERAVIRFPRDKSHNPNNRRTPVCSEKRLGPTSNLAAGIAATVRWSMGKWLNSGIFTPGESPARVVRLPDRPPPSAPNPSPGSAEGPGAKRSNH